MAATANVQFTLPSMTHMGITPSAKLGLHSMTPSVPSKFRQTCPDCDTPTSVTRSYHCEHGHGPFAENALRRARPVKTDDGTVMVPFSPDEIADLSYAIPEDRKAVAALNPHPADGVGDLRPGPKSYWLTPPSKGTDQDKQMYAALLAAAMRDDVVWLTHLRIKDSIALYRLEVCDGHLALAEVIHPDLIKRPAELIDVEVTDDLRAVAENMAATATDVDFQAYADRTVEAIDAKAATKISEGAMTYESIDATDDDAADTGAAAGDLLAQLSAAIKTPEPAAIAEAV